MKSRLIYGSRCTADADRTSNGEVITYRVVCVQVTMIGVDFSAADGLCNKLMGFVRINDSLS